MRGVASELERLGYTLRSGGASGADQYFESGISDPANAEIYLPWRDFNGHPSQLCFPSDDARRMAEKHHPAWDRCSSAAKKMHARNAHQVLGPTLREPSSFILCWTKNGRDVGGTGLAIRIARAKEIPVINLFKKSWRPELEALLT